MGTSRRDFLKKGSLVALAAGVPLGLAETITAAAASTPSITSGLSMAAFRAQLNTEFRVNAGTNKVALKLVEVTDLHRAGRFAHKEGFSLVFRGNQATGLKQSTYLFEHEQLGSFSFLIVPVMSKRRETQHYEAIVNRLHP